MVYQYVLSRRREIVGSSDDKSQSKSSSLFYPLRLAGMGPCRKPVMHCIGAAGLLVRPEFRTPGFAHGRCTHPNSHVQIVLYRHAAACRCRPAVTTTTTSGGHPCAYHLDRFDVGQPLLLEHVWELRLFVTTKRRIRYVVVVSLSVLVCVLSENCAHLVLDLAS